MPSAKPQARVVLALFAATLVVGLILLVAFDTDVQSVDARELVSRRHAARQFFAGDYVFLALYGPLSALALWRFGAALGAGWIRLGAGLLLLASAFDAAENALLLSATGSVSQDTVDAAHTVAVPKTIFFVAGAAFALAANWRAGRVLRAPE
ncbi:MAG: hypothetical protein QOE65_531 [Solirubrobacteraceae bacterium]|jgi:hypothetical protein|nr:hypothetical protein [Solirubrobacteraceae bacterium]